MPRTLASIYAPPLLPPDAYGAVLYLGPYPLAPVTPIRGRESLSYLGVFPPDAYGRADGADLRSILLCGAIIFPLADASELLDRVYPSDEIVDGAPILPSHEVCIPDDATLASSRVRADAAYATV